MPYDKVDRPAIEKMVREFYAVIIKDDLVGPYFIRFLGNDLKNDKWYEHLHVLDEFWTLMMTGESNYKGHPFPPHVFIGPLDVETFERWLKIFHEVVYGLFVTEIADEIYKKAQLAAEQFIENLGLDDEDD